MAFSLLGIVGTVINKIKNIKRQKLITEEAQYDSLNGNVKGVCACDTIVDSSLNSTPIRSAETTEKIKKILQAKAFGHEIVFRKVGKSTEELVVDNIVYAEQTVGFITKPYSMSAIINGHNITVGMFQGNYIQVDGVVLATSVRWF